MRANQPPITTREVWDGMSVIVNHWDRAFTRQYGYTFPDTFLSIDTEYTGGNDQKDIILEIGHTLVQDGEIVNRLNLILDWTDHPVVSAGWLRSALGRCRAQNPKFRITQELMAEEGLKPEEALEFYYDLFRRWQKQRGFFVAHNGFYADERMLIGNFEGFLGKDFRFGENSLFDTGALFKASQVIASSDPYLMERRPTFLPRPTDTLETYFRRVVHAHAPGIRWRLWDCVSYFGLVEKHTLDKSDWHNAQFDSYITALLMKEIHDRVTVNHAEEAPFDSSSSIQRTFEQEIAKDKEKQEKAVRRRQEGEQEFERNQAAGPVRRRKQRPV